MTDFTVETPVTAAKAHQCCECRGTIRKGTQYFKISGVQDGSGFSYKMCSACREAQVWLDGELRKAGMLNSDEGLELGGLRSELAEYASEARFKDVPSLRHLLGMAERTQQLEPTP